ncbi:MAG: SusC/RagA family TonB-linked outer membrane protein, partial [Muribaculaceae bacterium]|nr:SusC/RagA family TonB-linked outer membrane protein [Muribaculaceae bacterium]
SNASGAPGSSNPSISVRGFSTVSTASGANSPLIIVDGAPFTGNINSLNTNDIETMTVLKDAASAALYGARGANGVILITTKRAKLGEAKVTVDAKWGANSRATQDYDYVKNPAQYYELYYQSLYNYAHMPQMNGTGALENQNIGGMGMSSAAANAWANQNITASNSYGLAYNIYTLPEGQNLIGMNGKLNPNATLGRMVNYRGQDFWLYPDNWLDYTYKTSMRQEYNVSITQGTEKSNIMASVGYLKNEGIVVSRSQFERFTARVAADFQAKPWLKVGASAQYAHVETDAMSSEGSSSSTGNMFAFAVGIPPIYPLFMRDGNKQIMMDAQNFPRYDYGAGLNAGLTRPVFNGSNAISDALLNVNNTIRNVFSGSVFAEVRFLKDFKFTTNNTINLLEYRSTSTNNPYYGQMATQNGIVNKSHVRNTDMNFQQLLTWNHVFNRSHTVDLLAGHEYYKREMLSLSGSKTGMFDPSNIELDGAILADGPADSNKYTYNNEGWLFRGQYDYEGKYFASASYRRDASSRFHPDHRWGNFWSVGGAWIISKEDFFNADWANMLKLKVSYGEQGNDNIGEFLYTDTYALINAVGNPGVTPGHKGNKDITWEKNGNLNAGVEFGFFNNRLNGEINGFYRRTSDMLMYFTLPASYGFMGYYD